MIYALCIFGGMVLDVMLGLVWIIFRARVLGQSWPAGPRRDTNGYAVTYQGRGVIVRLDQAGPQPLSAQEIDQAGATYLKALQPARKVRGQDDPPSTKRDWPGRCPVPGCESDRAKYQIACFEHARKWVVKTDRGFVSHDRPLGFVLEKNHARTWDRQSEALEYMRTLPITGRKTVEQV